MRTLAPEITALLQQRGGLITHVLVWLTARNRDTGAAETLGLWTGADHAEIVVGGQARNYYGAGGMMGMDALTARAGLEVRQHTLTVSPLAPEVVTALRVYDPRLAPVEIHELYCDPISEKPVANAVRVFRGTVMQAPIHQPAEGAEATAEIVIASAAWALTRGLPLKRSHGALQARASADRFREYADLGRAVEAVWGEKRGSQKKEKPVQPVNPFPGRG